MYCHCSHRKKSLLFVGGGLILFFFSPQCRQGHLLVRLSLPKGSDFIILVWVSYCCLTPLICSTTSILTAITSCSLPAGRWWNFLELRTEQKQVYFCLFLSLSHPMQTKLHSVSPADCPSWLMHRVTGLALLFLLPSASSLVDTHKSCIIFSQNIRDGAGHSVMAEIICHEVFKTSESC